MKKLLLILLLFPLNSFAESGKCHRQSNPMGYTNYDVCEVTGTGYTCVSLDTKGGGGISCFPTPKQEQDERQVRRKDRFNDSESEEN